MIKDAYGNTRFYGLYRGTVYRNDDPNNHRRLQLKVPQVFADQNTGWAWSSGDNGTKGTLPDVGAGVWVMFEGGDPSYPVWVGAFNSYLDGPSTTVTNTTVNNSTSVIQGSLLGKYGAFQYTGTQTATTTTAQAFPWDTTDFSEDVYTSNTSRVYFPTEGLYNIQWSGQFQNTDNAIQDISVWLRINGVDVPGSTGFISIPARKSASAGQEAHIIVGWNYFLRFTAGQYLEILWSATATTVSLQSYAAGTSPTRPTTAALILTASQVG